MYQAHFGLNIEDIKTYLLMNPIKDYRQGDDHRPWSLPWSLRLAPNLEHETPWPSHLHNSWSGLLIVVEHGNVWGSSLKKMFKLDHGQDENPPLFSRAHVRTRTCRSSREGRAVCISLWAALDFVLCLVPMPCTLFLCLDSFHLVFT